jgi:hypothetical protein
MFGTCYMATVLYQEVVAHRVPAASVERLEERPHCRGEHSALIPRQKFMAQTIHVWFGIERVG